MEFGLIIFPSFLTAVLCFFGKNKKFIYRASLWGSMIGLLLSFPVSVLVLQTGAIQNPSLGLYCDSISAYMITIVLILAVAVSFSSKNFMEFEEKSENLTIHSWRSYYGLFHIFVLSILFIFILNNIGLMWVAMEATTLSSAFLVGFHRHHHSLEAAWKYIILCSVGIAFALLGTILLYYASIHAGNGHSLLWTDFMENAEKLDTKIFKLAFLFLVIGYGTKVGLAPMHNWLPDAHSQAPSPISAILSGALLTSAFYALIRFYSIATHAVGPEFAGRILLFLGILSIAVAAPFILIARDYKRMLAYSSIEHMGIIAFGFGLGIPQAIYGAFLHTLCHALSKGLAFLSAGQILQTYKTRKITKVYSAVNIIPKAGIPFFISLLILSGLPPFGIFTSEFIVLSAGFNSGKILLSSLALILLVIVFAGLLYHGLKMSFAEPKLNLSVPIREDDKNDEDKPTKFMTNFSDAWIILVTIFIGFLFLLGIKIPSALDFWINSMIKIVQGHLHA